MTSKNPKDQGKTPSARATQTPELQTRELDKVVGGLKKSGGPKSGVIDDPCGGGE